MASKSKRLRQNTELLNKTILRIGYASVFAFLIKLLIIWRISNLTISQAQGHIWLGADGENYLKGVDGLINDGILSKEQFLYAWPAGYPILIYFLTIFGKTYSLTLLSIIQSIFFSWSVYSLITELSKGKLRKFCLIIFILINFNPTLSLSSLSIGYESICASGFIFIISLLHRDLRELNSKRTIIRILLVSLISGIQVFVQPRLIISSIIIIPIWAIYLLSRKFSKVILVLTISFTLILTPIFALIFRNQMANDMRAISTNLGLTMSIGAGDTTGGYNGKHLLPCRITEIQVSKIDNQRIKCVIDWYKTNPTKALKLFYNKSIYFWSPWFGPEANGTMARNPWLTIHPFKNMTKTQDGINLLYGSLGKIISWIWLLSGLFLVFYGFLILWRQKFEVRLIAGIAGFIVFSSWLVTLISIGDHRFRLPIMGASLFLQAVGIRTLFAGGKPPMVQPVDLR